MAQFAISKGTGTYNVTVPDDVANSTPPDQLHSQLVAMIPDDGPATPAPSTPPATPDTSLSSAFGYGVDAAAKGLAKTGSALSNAPGMGWLAGPSKTLAGATSAPAGYTPADVGGDIKNGKWSSLPSDVLRSGVESLPQTGAMLGAGALGAAVAPEALAGAAGIGGVAAASGALNYGNNLQAVQTNNGDATPTAGDYTRAGLTTAGQSALNAVGLRVPGLSESIGPVASAGAKIAADAATSAVSDQVGQLGNSVGTAKGTQDNPYETAGAGLTAAATRAATVAPGLAKGGVKAATDGVMSRIVAQPADVDHAVAIEQANQAMDDARSSLPAKAAPTVVANSAKSQVATTLASTFRTLRDNYPTMISPDDAANFQGALGQALRHNNQTGTSANPDVATLLDQVQGLSLPPEALTPLVQGLRTLDVLSNASFNNQTVGPFRAIGNGVSQAAGVAGALSTGNPLAIVGAVAGHNTVGKLGGAVGGMVDNAMGTNTPVAVLQRAAAQRMLAGTNTPQPQNVVAQLQGVRGGVADAQAQMQATQLKQQQTDAAYASQASQEAAQAAQLKSFAANYPKAEDQLPQVPNPTDAYMAGKPLPGMDSPGSVGSQTASEIAQWAQSRRNAATALKQGQQQLGVLQAADDASIENVAQGRLDKATRLNAAKLLQSTLTPQPFPGVDTQGPEAAAAVQSAMSSAASIMHQAGGTFDPDSATVGNPQNPVPVNTPISAQGVPQSAPNQAPARPPAAPTPSPVGQPQPAPRAPPAATTGHPPWMNYMVGPKGAPGVTPDHVSQAMDAMAAENPSQAHFMSVLANHQGGADPTDLNPIRDRAASIARSERGAVGLPPVPGDWSVGTLPPDPTVRRPAAYQAAVVTYHTAAAKLALAAVQAGLPEVSQTVEAIQHTRAPADKEQLRTSALASIADPVARAKAARFLPDYLVNHGKK